jgi:ankyrin repeat protein
VDGAYLVALPKNNYGTYLAAERVVVGLEHLALDWLDADAARGQARRLGRRERLIEQTVDGELVGRLLAEAGVDVDVDVTVDTTDADGDKESVTPLTRAAVRGHLEAVRLLLDAGADRDHMDGDGETPLMCAVRKGRLGVLRLLLARGGGADLDRANSNGDTLLMVAGARGRLEVLRLLLARGAAVDAAHPRDGCTAFHFACYNNHAECAEALARAGCDVSLHDRQGRTGRELAEAQGHTAVVQRLRAVVADQLRGRGRAEAKEYQVMLARTRSAEKWWALAAAKAELARLKAMRGGGSAPVHAKSPVQEELTAVMVEPEPEPEPARAGGERLAGKLVRSAWEGDALAVSQLLAAGADPNASVPAPDASGEVVQTTAMYQAVAYGRLEAARLLLDAGADPDRTAGDGAIPLMVAAANGQLEVLRLLLARGAVVDAAHPHVGCTALHYACFGNHVECAEALVLAGCDTGLQDNEGKTGRELAERKGHTALVERLRVVVAQRLRALDSDLVRLRALEAERTGTGSGGGGGGGGDGGGAGGGTSGAKKKRKKRSKKKRTTSQVCEPRPEPEWEPEWEPEPEPEPEIEREPEPEREPESEPEPAPEPEVASSSSWSFPGLLPGVWDPPDTDPVAGVLAELGLLEHLPACHEHEIDLGARLRPAVMFLSRSSHPWSALRCTAPTGAADGQLLSLASLGRRAGAKQGGGPGGGRDHGPRRCRHRCLLR